MTAYLDNNKLPEQANSEFRAYPDLNKAPLHAWGYSKVHWSDDMQVLDLGCAGGDAIAAMLQKFEGGLVDGVTSSEERIGEAEDRNREAVDDGRTNIYPGEVPDLPLQDSTYDLVTAFEVVYFWQPLDQCFLEVFRVLKPEGTFLICNESDGTHPKDDLWAEAYPGMTFYRTDELLALLEETGFQNIKVFSSRHALCITAEKGRQSS